MTSCWLIHFEDGNKIIISEKLYEYEKKRGFAGHKQKYHQHWFSIQQCRQDNQGIICAGFDYMWNDTFEPPAEPPTEPDIILSHAKAEGRAEGRVEVIAQVRELVEKQYWRSKESDGIVGLRTRIHDALDDLAGEER